MVNVLANNVKISNVKIVENSENTIICKAVREEFFGVYTLDMGDDKILCEYSGDDTVIINLKMEGKEYKDLHFKLIVDANFSPEMFINRNPFKPIVKIKPDPIAVTESLSQKSLINEDLKTLDLEFQKKIKEKERIIKNLNEEIEKISHINTSKIELEKEEIEENIKNTIEEGVEKYKQKLLEDFFETSHQQNKLKDNLIKNTIESLEEVFSEKYIESVAEIRSTSIEEVKEYSQNFLNNLSKSLNERHIKDLSDLQDLTKDTIKNDLFLVTGELQDRFKSQVNVNRDELYEKLETYKGTVQKEIFEIFENYGDRIKIESNKNLEKRINETKNNIIAKYVEDIEKSNNDLKRELVQQIAVVEEKIDRKRVEQIKFDSNELVAEAARLLIEKDSKASNRLKKFKDEILKDLQKAAENYTTEANKRMMRYAEMMSGGGSNAVQYANGGTMNGNLNVAGNINSQSMVVESLSATIINAVSAHITYLDIKSYELSGFDVTGNVSISGNLNTTGNIVSNNIIYDQTGNSQQWNHAYDTSTTYQNASGSFATNTLLQSTSALLTPLTLTRTLTSQLVLNTDFNSYRTNVAAATATLLPTTIYQNASGSFATNTLLQSTSALLTPLTLTNSLTSQLVLNADFNSYKTNVAAATATLLPTTVYRSASGSFATNTLLQSTSALLTPLALTNTLTGQLVLNTNFSNYQTSVAASTATLVKTTDFDSYKTNVATATASNISYVHSNFLPLTGGIVSGPTRINNNLTIFGNLSASGTTTFANTIFTTTSALSVVHVGSGPAMWVGNNGDGDIASFYDMDQNVEVLHVGGNNGAFPHVGIKTSSPNTTLTVNGEISANNTIYDATGNSQQWNTAFNRTTQYQNTSASFATNTLLQSTSALLTPLTVTRILTGQLVLNADFNSYKTNVAAATATLLPITTYQSASGSFATNTLLQSTSALLTPLTLTNTLTSQLVLNTNFSNYQTSVAAATATLLPTTIYQSASGNWQSTYTTVQANSASWEESAEILPTVTNYLSTSNVLMSAVNVTTDVIANRIQATVKNFYIKHPTKPDKHLVYSSLETPYNGVQLTGEAEVINGKCVVQLPDYMHGLIHWDNVHVQLTNCKHSNILYVGSIDIKDNKFVVKCDSWINKFKTLKFFWLLNGVRKDIELLQTEV